MGNTKTLQKTISYSKDKNLNVRLRGKRLSSGAISLYLDFYKGYSKDESGSVKTQRKIEYLKLYLLGNPRSTEDREKYNETLRLAQKIRENRESDLQHNAEGLIAPYRKKTNFFDYFQAYLDGYQKKDARMIKTAKQEFQKFVDDTYIVPKQIDKALITGFRDYLLNNFNGETPNSIFARFKKVLRAATDEGLFIKFPAEGITCPYPKDNIPKAILMPEEIIKLAETKCSNAEVKRAFLFCLNTALRFVDVEDLKFKHIENGKIRKKQQKTGREVIIDLNETAINLIGEMGSPDAKVFNLPTLTGALKTLKTWTANAEINKNITWHSARHSVATILLMRNTDIKTVGSILGHSRIEHTQKYTHVIDNLKEAAMDKLPTYSTDF